MTRITDGTSPGAFRIVLSALESHAERRPTHLHDSDSHQANRTAKCRATGNGDLHGLAWSVWDSGRRHTDMCVFLRKSIEAAMARTKQAANFRPHSPRVVTLYDSVHRSASPIGRNAEACVLSELLAAPITN